MIEFSSKYSAACGGVLYSLAVIVAHGFRKRL